VSTSICDVVRPYGQLGIVRIADTVVEFRCKLLLNESRFVQVAASGRWVPSQTSWDRTWTRMMQLVASKISVLASRLKQQVEPGERSC